MAAHNVMHVSDVASGSADPMLWERLSADLCKVDPALVLARPQPADMTFAEDLYMAVTEPLSRAIGHWDEQEARQNYRDKVDAREVRMVVFRGDRVGWLQLRQELVIRICQIHLIEDARGSGIGSNLITAILQVAAGMMAPVELSVLPNNPASELYRRLGFMETSRQHDRVNYRWTPPVSSATAEN